MRKVLFPILNVASIQHFVGSNPARIFDFGLAPEKTLPPYIVYSQVVDQPYEQLSGAPTADLVTLQVDCYCASMGETRALAQVIRQQLDVVGYSNRLAIQTYEQDTGLYRMGFEVDWIELR